MAVASLSSGLQRCTMKTGSCLCGRVRLRLHGPALRIGLCSLPGLSKGARRALRGVRHRPGDESRDRGGRRPALLPDALGSFEAKPGYRRHFCAACGSPVMGTMRDSNELELRLGSFDVPSTSTPTYEAWTVRRESWLGDRSPLERTNGQHRAIRLSLPVACHLAHCVLLSLQQTSETFQGSPQRHASRGMAPASSKMAPPNISVSAR